jgi:ribosomal 30S subunit maturation factor RimM
VHIFTRFIMIGYILQRVGIVGWPRVLTTMGHHSQKALKKFFENPLNYNYKGLFTTTNLARESWKVKFTQMARLGKVRGFKT